MMSFLQCTRAILPTVLNSLKCTDCISHRAVGIPPQYCTDLPQVVDGVALIKRSTSQLIHSSRDFLQVVVIFLGAGAIIHSHSVSAFLATVAFPGNEFKVTHMEMIKGITNDKTGKTMRFGSPFLFFLIYFLCNDPMSLQTNDLWQPLISLQFHFVFMTRLIFFQPDLH